jgi:RNA polymerase sigma factor (sigma-70 family)
LRACTAISTLRDPARLRPWLMAIARNQAWQTLRRRRHLPTFVQLGAGSVETGDATTIWSPTPSPADAAELAELRAEVRAAVENLSGTNAEIVRAFYLDGMTTGRIAERLGLPAGTVRWRLSEARRLLREEFTMSEITDDHRNVSQAAPLLDVKAINGTSGPVERLRPQDTCKTLLSQQVLYCVRKELKTPAEISRQVKADVDYVQDHLDRMAEADVVTHEDGRYRANCILFDADDVAAVKEELMARGDVVAATVEGHGRALSDAIRQTTPAARGFEEPYLRWLVVPVMLLNFGLGRALRERVGAGSELPLRPDGGRWVFLPTLVDSHLPWELGCNWTAATAGECGTAQHWNSDLEVRITRVRGTPLCLLRRLATGPVRKDSAVDVFTEEVVTGLVEAGVIRCEGDRLVEDVPIFTPRDGDLLDPVISAVVGDIIERAYADYPDDIYALLDRRGFGFVRLDYPGHVHMLAQMGSVRALRRSGFLVDPARPAPNGWGFFAWTGVFAPMAAHW